MKTAMSSYDGMPSKAKDVKETKMLDTGARESAKRTTGTPNNDRSTTKHKAFGALGNKGHA